MTKSSSTNKQEKTLAVQNLRDFRNYAMEKKADIVIISNNNKFKEQFEKCLNAIEQLSTENVIALESELAYLIFFIPRLHRNTVEAYQNRVKTLQARHKLISPDVTVQALLTWDEKIIDENYWQIQFLHSPFLPTEARQYIKPNVKKEKSFQNVWTNVHKGIIIHAGKHPSIFRNAINGLLALYQLSNYEPEQCVNTLTEHKDIQKSVMHILKAINKRLTERNERNSNSHISDYVLEIIHSLVTALEKMPPQKNLEKLPKVLLKLQKNFLKLQESEHKLYIQRIIFENQEREWLKSFPQETDDQKTIKDILNHLIKDLTPPTLHSVVRSKFLELKTSLNPESCTLEQVQRLREEIYDLLIETFHMTRVEGIYIPLQKTVPLFQLANKPSIIFKEGTDSSAATRLLNDQIKPFLSQQLSESRFVDRIISWLLENRFLFVLGCIGIQGETKKLIKFDISQLTNSFAYLHVKDENNLALWMGAQGTAQHITRELNNMFRNLQTDNIENTLSRYFPNIFELERSFAATYERIIDLLRPVGYEKLKDKFNAHKAHLENLQVKLRVETAEPQPALEVDPIKKIVQALVTKIRETGQNCSISGKQLTDYVNLAIPVLFKPIVLGILEQNPGIFQTMIDSMANAYIAHQPKQQTVTNIPTVSGSAKKTGLFRKQVSRISSKLSITSTPAQQPEEPTIFSQILPINQDLLQAFKRSIGEVLRAAPQKTTEQEQEVTLYLDLDRLVLVEQQPKIQAPTSPPIPTPYPYLAPHPDRSDTLVDISSVASQTTATSHAETVSRRRSTSVDDEVGHTLGTSSERRRSPNSHSDQGYHSSDEDY